MLPFLKLVLMPKCGVFVNMVEAGIVDPAKVTRCVLQNATSIAGLMITTETIISEPPEEKKDSAFCKWLRNGQYAPHVLILARVIMP